MEFQTIEMDGFFSENATRLGAKNLAFVSKKIVK
jgi:hypothetical protein